MNRKNEFKKYAVKHMGMSSTTVEDYEKYQAKNYGLTPMVLEERQLNMTQLSVFDRLMLDRILWVSGVVDDQMSDIVQAQLLFLESNDPDRDISMYLDTPGGSCQSGLNIAQMMQYVKPDVATINVGTCASMGSVLLSVGTPGKRSSTISSKVMLHHVSSGSGGVIDEMRINQMEAEKYNFLLFKMLAQNCGKTFEEVHDLASRDLWLNSDEAKGFGIIDHIIGLEKNKSITELMDGFDDYYDKYVYSRKK